MLRPKTSNYYKSLDFWIFYDIIYLTYFSHRKGITIMKKRTFFQEYYYNEDFWYVNTAPKSSFFNMELMGITYADPSYRVNRSNQWDMYIFEYVTDGVGYIRCNGKKYTVKKGDAYIVSKFTEHEYYADPEQPYKKIWMNVSGDLIDSLLQLFNLSYPVVIRHVDLEEYFRRLHEHLDKEYDMEKIGSVIYSMIYRMSENFNTQQKQDLSLAERMKMYIDKNIKQNLCTADVADHFHITPIYASRIFKAKYQQTINQYIMSSTMELAKQWLKNSNYTIKEISDLLGFCNEKYFSTQFKKYYDISPKQYQLKHNQRMVCNVPISTEDNA